MPGFTAGASLYRMNFVSSVRKTSEWTVVGEVLPSYITPPDIWLGPYGAAGITGHGTSWGDPEGETNYIRCIMDCMSQFGVGEFNTCSSYCQTYLRG
jgi:hypothetical protein